MRDRGACDRRNPALRQQVWRQVVGRDQKPGAQGRVGGVGRGQGADGRRRWPLKRQGNRCQPLGRGKAALREFGDVVRAREIGLAGGLDARNPAPAQRVGGRIAVQQVTQKEIRAKLPWQAQGENPDRGEPHARVIVQVAGCGQLPRPSVKAFNAGFALAGGFPPVAQAALRGGVVQRAQQPRAILRPHRRPKFEPAFPVGAPKHLLNELFGGLGAVTSQNRLQHLFLGQAAVPDPRREAGDIAVLPGAVIFVAARGIGASGVWQEPRQGRQCAVSVGGEWSVGMHHGAKLGGHAGQSIARAPLQPPRADTKTRIKQFRVWSRPINNRCDPHERSS